MLRSIGMDPVQAFNYNMGIQSVNIFATAIAICLMGRIGRRIFYLFGSGAIGGCMLVIGIMGFVAGDNRKSIAIPVAVFMIAVQCAFKISLGPTTYVIVGEMPSNRVRAQTIVLGRGIYVCCGLVVQQINPRMLNSTSDAWNLGAKTGMVYFCLCFAWVIYIWFCLPETKNRSFADIDYLFKKKTSARKFSTAPIDCKCALACRRCWNVLTWLPQCSSSTCPTRPPRSSALSSRSSRLPTARSALNRHFNGACTCRVGTSKVKPFAMV